MLLVLFQLGSHRYALAANRVVEVLPLLALRHVPQSARGVAGIFVYRGQPVPALDLCELTLGRPAHEHLSTRILLVQHRVRRPATKVETPNVTRPGQPLDSVQLIGLIVERVTGTLRRDEKDFVTPEMHLPAAPFLGPVLMDDQGVIQLLDAQKLLDAGGQPLLLTPSMEANDASH